MSYRATSIFLIVLTLASLGFTLVTTAQKIGEPFPGHLSYQNGVVGILRSAQPTLESTDSEKQIFTSIDYFWVVILPAVSGFLFMLLGVGSCFYLAWRAELSPLISFHFLFGNFLILLPEVHLTHHLSAIFLLILAFLPATMLHGRLFPASDAAQRRAWLRVIPYGLSGILAVPYLYFFFRDPARWVQLGYVLFFYFVLAYILWLSRLVRISRTSYPSSNRSIARYLVAGQLVGFLIPLGAAAAIFLGQFPLPFNLLSPLTLLFPLCLLVGVLLARLHQSQVQLVQTDRLATMGNLLAGLAHEINNPLGFIYSNLEPLKELIAKLKETLPDPEGKAANLYGEMGELVDTMEDGATRTREIVENFRHFSYQGRRSLEAMDLNQVLAQSIALVAPKWRDRIRIIRKFGVIPQVRGFRSELGQVFLNILANACDATPKRGTIRVRTWQEGGSAVTVSIQDTGVGIPREHLGRIFDPFFTTKPQGEGTGLGLAIALQIVHKHQGKMEVNSEAGKGTRVLISLPLSPQPTPRDLEEAEEAGIQPRSLLKGDSK